MSIDPNREEKFEINSSSHSNEAPISSDLKYVRKQTISQTLEDIESIRKFDAIHEEKEKEAFTHGFIGTGIMILGIAVGISGAAISASDMIGLGGFVIALGVICGVTGLVYLIKSIITKLKNARLNLDNKRYECLCGLLNLLSADTAKDAIVATQIDFGKDVRDDTHVRTGKVGPWEVKYHQNTWFALAGQLIDGTRYSITMKEKIQNRSKSKISASGKHKVKYKSKRGEDISLKIRVKEKRYPNLSSVASDAEQAIQLPEYAAVKSFSVEPTSLTLVVSISDQLPQKNLWRSSGLTTDQNVSEPVKERVQLLAMMMLSAYQVLNKTKVVTES